MLNEDINNCVTIESIEVEEGKQLRNQIKGVTSDDIESIDPILGNSDIAPIPRVTKAKDKIPRQDSAKSQFDLTFSGQMHSVPNNEMHAGQATGAN